MMKDLLEKMEFVRVQVKREVCKLFAGDVEDHCRKGLGEWGGGGWILSSRLKWLRAAGCLPELAAHF